MKAALNVAFEEFETLAPVVGDRAQGETAEVTHIVARAPRDGVPEWIRKPSPDAPVNRITIGVWGWAD